MGLLSGFIGGLAQGGADASNYLLQQQDKEAAAESAFQRQLKLLDAQLERQKAARLEKAKEIDTEAGQLAQGRARGLIDAARTAYADNPEGLAAVEDAEKRGAYAQEVTAEDRIRAGAKLGYRDDMDVMRIEQTKEAGIRADRKAAIDADNADAANKRADAHLAIAEKQLKATLAVQARALAKEARTDADRAEAENATELLAQYLSDESKAPGKYTQQILQETGRLKRLGVDPTPMLRIAGFGASSGEKRTVTLDEDGQVVGEKVTTTSPMTGQAKPGAGGKPLGSGWDSATGEVFRNGKLIGKAKTEADARKMVRGT